MSSTPPTFPNFNFTEGEMLLINKPLTWTSFDVVGKIRKGNLLVSSHIPGVATALVKSQWQPGCVIGKALDAYDSSEPGVIEIVIGRL